MGLLENWDEIQKEFDLWEKTINRDRNIAIGLMVVGAVVAMATSFLTGSLLFLLPLIGFRAGGFSYQVIIGDRNIQAHQDRIDELKK